LGDLPLVAFLRFGNRIATIERMPTTLRERAAMDHPLPPVFTAYFAADAAADADALAACFRPDATVLDEGRRHAGPEAVKNWMQEAKAKYHYTAEPLRWTRQGQTVTVSVRVSGSFPGSPIELTYLFVLPGDRIASLEIHP